MKVKKMSDKIITRFAPSPTGFLHIGGARTALFNWVFARKMSGKMLLRIEDTDRARSTDAAIDAILDGLSWLGITWDDEPISQFANKNRHIEIANQLVKSGHAYKCYCTKQQLEQKKQQAIANAQSPQYDETCRNLSPDKAPKNIDPVIRIKVDKKKNIIVQDKVQGDVVFKGENLDDFIILRSDGTPTYMLAVVVDDHDMGITHIIRGDDHLTNAARQIIIYQALNWDIPTMAHIPLIHGADGAKLSKRHGALGVDAYRKMGYLPDALRNYLARLGWSHGDDEIFSTEQMIEWFNLEDLNKGASRFDFAKLANINAIYIRKAEPSELFEKMLSLANELNLKNDILGLENYKTTVLNALPILVTRAKTILDLIDLSKFIYTIRPIELDEKANNILTTENKKMLGEIILSFEDISDWTSDNLKPIIKQYADLKGVKFGAVAQPIRAALAGRFNSPGIFEVMTLIGKTETILRLKYHSITTG